MGRRAYFLLTLALCALPGLRAAEPAIDFEALQFRAKLIAAQPFKEKPSRVPASLREFNYDDYRMIQFDPALAWWSNERRPFELQFFHPGGLYNRTVELNELVGAESKRIEYSPRMFRYRGKKPWSVPADIGFAGFRIEHALNQPDKLDEVAVFLGASYFRALARAQHYGLSARGLALNTGDPAGEEFPVFEEFWIERPAADAKSVTVYALMDSPSVTGAYQFVITPGVETVIRVRMVVYCRKNPRVFGVAPLTSMFAHGENSGWSQADYRPEVHDSDGLLLATGTGEWIWRPLTNPGTVRVTTFADGAPRGFGLLQRDRQFEHFDDLEACYQMRPSVWVEPLGHWGPGSVRLVELPTADEINDNIAAFWMPAQLPPPGEPIAFEYNLHWMTDPGPRPPAGFVASTRLANVMGRRELKRFVVEFTGGDLTAAPDDPEIEAVVTVGAGARQEGAAVVQRNRFANTWRVVFELKPDPSAPPVELRCFLRKGQHVLTETWSYLWNH